MLKGVRYPFSYRDISHRANCRYLDALAISGPSAKARELNFSQLLVLAPRSPRITVTCRTAEQHARLARRLVCDHHRMHVRDNAPPLRTIAALTLLGALMGCSGGSSETPPPGGAGTPPDSQDNPPPPTANPPAGADPLPPAFGLTQRESLSITPFPIETVPVGSFIAENAFPARNFVHPLFVAGIPDTDHIVVVQQDGLIVAFDRDDQSTATNTFLDIRSRTVDSGEQGLIGFALAADFSQSGLFYVHYVAQSPRRSVIAEYAADVATLAAPASSERILLEVTQPFTNHNGGSLAIGPDGFLYIALGDGGSGGDPLNSGQDTNTLLGSLLRIDPNPGNRTAGDAYLIPADNPFVGDPGVRGEIWAFGLRNPFRFSFDRDTGDLWLGDVGQGAFEEIDLIQRGGNYGWRVFEGNAPFDNSANSLADSAFVPPVIDYERTVGASVIGGYVYRGARLASIRGAYLYADFVSRRVFSLRYDGANVVENVEIANLPGNPTSFGEDNNGELFITTRGGGLFELQEIDSGGADPLPALLSQTGVFADMATLQTTSGFVEYSVNAPFWSDGADKRRWIAIPDGQGIGFTATSSWDFPVGSIIVKHFEIALDEASPDIRRRLETRFLVRENTRWAAYTYRWNADGTDADLIASRQTETLSITQTDGTRSTFDYEFPARNDCQRCHTDAAGNILGVRTRQLNRDRDYAAVTDNQLRSLNNINLFRSSIGPPNSFAALPDLSDTQRELAQRARAYLHTNCAQCHQPNGGTPVALDFRFDTPLGSTQALDVAPSAGDLGISDARIVAPGDAARSVLVARMRATDNNRMPPIGSHRVDQAGVDLMERWINTL